MILHGGDNGELDHHFKGSKEYIFQMTSTQLLKYDLDGDEKFPKLEALFLMAQNKTFLNLEVKAPHNPTVRAMYNYRLCVEKVYELIRKYNL